jgi:putative SOS response-associated peptidase YedK
MDTLAKAMERQKQTGHATVQLGEQEAVEAYPGMRVPLLLPDKTGALQVASLAWGLKPQSRSASPTSGLIFNTRLDTALDQMQKGYGMWHEAIRFGRCLVPVRWFYETSRSQHVISEATGKKILAQYRFSMPGKRVFLLAAVATKESFSIVTTAPNKEVGAVHTRMPLVLGPGESTIWLGQNFVQLADRSGISLVSNLAS